jgi:hypothetical protein
MQLWKHNVNEGAGPWWRTLEWTLYSERIHESVAKGWWSLLPERWYGGLAEIELAIGGEDNMVQVGGSLKPLGRAYAGVRVPRSWTKGWVYERREVSLELGGTWWINLQLGVDDSMADMLSYYRRKREAPDCGGCGHAKAMHDAFVVVYPSRVKSLDDVERLATRVPNPTRRCITHSEILHGVEPCECRAYVKPKEVWPTDAMLRNGIRWRWDPKVKDRLLGRREYSTVELEKIQTSVSLPEGQYPAEVTIIEERWQRERMPWPSRVKRASHIEMGVPIPVPGKGENSWDCGDDGIYATGSSSPTVSGAVSSMVASVLRTRERYAGDGWVPDAGWPEGVAG